MATLNYSLTASAWTLVSTGGCPSVWLVGADARQYYVYVGTGAPLIGETNITLIGGGNLPYDVGPLGAGVSMWLRSVTGTVAVSVIDTGSGGAIGTGATALGKAEDAASASGDTGVATLGVRRDTLIIPAGTDLDYGMISLDKYGAQRVGDVRRAARWYSASANAIVAVASAGDIFAITGNANTKVWVTKIIVTGVHATGNLITVLARKRSTANTGGTSSAVTAIPHDSADAAAQATLLAYTGNPTGGTIVGSLRTQKMALPPATAAACDPLEFNFGENGGKGILLNAATDVLAINLNNATTAGTFDISAEWYEVDA